MNLNEQLKSRGKLFLILFKGPNIILTILGGIVLSILFFQVSQSLGGIIVLCLLHFDRKDLQFCQIAYADNYKKIILLEYLIIYTLFALIAFFLNDPILVFAPLLFFGFMLFINIERFKFKNRSRLNINRFISSTNYEWKVGFAKSGLKLIILTIAFAGAVFFIKVVYLYNIYLFLTLLVIKDFYIEKEPSIFLEFRGKTRKQISISTIKMHFKTLTALVLPVSAIQIFIFYNNIFIIYSASGLISAYLLVFFFAVEKYKKFGIEHSMKLIKIKNAFLSIATLLPPISLFIAALNFIWLNEIEQNDPI